MHKRTADWTVDVTEAEFSEKILRASHRRPVLVDFWASWCAPCRTLTPVLEKLADEFKGAFLLARLNIEEAPQLAVQFRIQSIPLVVLFQNEKPVDQFIGVLPEADIRKFLRKYCQTEVDELISSGKEKLDRGDFQGAQRCFQQGLEREPTHPGALLGLAQIASQHRKPEEMENYLNQIDPSTAEAEEAETLKARRRFQILCEQFGGSETCRQRTEGDAEDLEARYQLGCCLAAEEQYEEALETLLCVVARDRTFQDEAARKAMLEIFKIVGTRAPLAEEYRTRLSREIF